MHSAAKLSHLRDLLSCDFYGVLFFAAVIQCGTIHVLIMKQGQFLHLLLDPCDFILDLKTKCINLFAEFHFKETLK